jgi:hypothetical protein
MAIVGGDDASVKAATAYATSVTAKTSEAPTPRQEETTLKKEMSADGGGSGLSSFLTASSAATTNAEEEGSRP